MFDGTDPFLRFNLYIFPGSVDTKVERTVIGRGRCVVRCFYGSGVFFSLRTTVGMRMRNVLDCMCGLGVILSGVKLRMLFLEMDLSARLYVVAMRDSNA